MMRHVRVREVEKLVNKSDLQKVSFFNRIFSTVHLLVGCRCELPILFLGGDTCAALRSLAPPATSASHSRSDAEGAGVLQCR